MINKYRVTLKIQPWYTVTVAAYNPSQALRIATENAAAFGFKMSRTPKHTIEICDDKVKNS